MQVAINKEKKARLEVRADLSRETVTQLVLLENECSNSRPFIHFRSESGVTLEVVKCEL